MTASASFLKTLPQSEKEELLKLSTLNELPKSRYATKLAVTAYPNARRGRKVVLSHIEVYKMVENVAGRMREAGVRPGTVCAFALPTSCESIIYFYALWWIAAIAAPIDPDLSEEEFEKAVKASGAKIIVSPDCDDSSDPLRVKCENVAKSLDLIEWHIYRTINEGVVLETHGRLMGSGAAWAGGSGDFKLDPEEIAVHIPSSTGVVPISHGAFCEAAKSFVSTYHLAIGMSTMLAPPLHDIHGMLILVAAFYSGGHIVLPGLSGFNPETFWELAAKHDITWLSAESSQILDLYEAREKVSGAKQQLTFVRSSGASCIAPELLIKVEASLNTKVYESYGTSETCGFATTNLPDSSKGNTVGKSVNGLEVAIFDTNSGEMCAVGEVGEIAVCGAHAAEKTTSESEENLIGERTHFETPADDPDATPTVWIATGDRGALDEEGYLTVHGSSRELHAAEIAAEEERKAKELELAAVAAAKAAEEAAVAEKKRLQEEEEARLAAEAAAREAEEKRIKEEEEARLAAEAAVKEAKAKRIMEEEEARKREEEAKKKEEEAAAAAAAALTAKEIAERSATLSGLGIENPEELDDETANAILARLEAIEANHRQLQKDVEGRNAAELEDMRRRVAEAEAEAERIAALTKNRQNGKVVDVRMEELEAAVLAAAASAESSANNTREAVKAAREVADAAYGQNHSMPVEVKASTGDQGSVKKTVKVVLDDVEKEIMKHPAVKEAKAFGRRDKRFGAEVFCAIVMKKGARVSEPWLKLHAQSRLQPQMVPKKFYYVTEIPAGITRRELSESTLLQDLSSFHGCTKVKHVKGPQWQPNNTSSSDRS